MTAIRQLHVFYDARCALCQACRQWLDRQPKYVPLQFVAYQSEEAERLCPGLERFRPDKEIVVMADNGNIYQGGAAWVMCFWALREYRALSQRLATPVLFPLARKICHLVSRNRLRLSRFFGKGANGDKALLEALDDEPADACPNGTCNLPRE